MVVAYPVLEDEGSNKFSRPELMVYSEYFVCIILYKESMEEGLATQVNRRQFKHEEKRAWSRGYMEVCDGRSIVDIY